MKQLTSPFAVLMFVGTFFFFAFVLKADTPAAEPAKPNPAALTAVEHEQMRLAYTRYVLARIKSLEALIQDRLGIAIQREEDDTMNAYNSLVSGLRTSKKLDAGCQMDVVKLEFACPVPKEGNDKANK